VPRSRLLCLLAWRVAQLAVMATPDGLTIRNFRNAHRIPWSAVEEIFEPGPVPLAVYKENPLAERKTGLFVRLREGAVISCTMYRKAFWIYGSDNFQVIRDAVAALNELRQRYAGGDPGRPG
jgi:Bacterial PH domain